MDELVVLFNGYLAQVPVPFCAGVLVVLAINHHHTPYHPHKKYWALNLGYLQCSLRPQTVASRASPTCHLATCLKEVLRNFHCLYEPDKM